MKRLISLALILVLCFSLGGCSLLGAALFSAEQEETILNEPMHSVPVTEPPTIEIPATEETLPPIPTVSVSDAFVDVLTLNDYYGTSTCCYHIPQFDMYTPETESYNRAIYMELYELLEENVYADPEYPFLYGMHYDWIQMENVVSLLVYVQCDWGISLYKVYNAFADGSGVATKDVLLERYGYDESSFYDLVAQRLKETYISMYSQYPGAETDMYYQQQLANTVSYENVKSVVPYISPNGDLCCVATIYSLAGADAYDYLVNLTGSAEVTYPSCPENHN